MNGIFCDGRLCLDDSGQYYDVSLSPIWSRLIQVCGRLVEDFNADLLIDISTVEKYVRKPLSETQEEKVFWLGFRKLGVDHEEFIKVRIENEYYYHALYKVTVTKTEDKCEARMEESTPWDFRREHGIDING